MDKKLFQLAKNVWLWPHDPEPEKALSAVGVVVGAEETVLVDAGNGSGLAGEYNNVLWGYGQTAKMASR